MGKNKIIDTLKVWAFFLFFFVAIGITGYMDRETAEELGEITRNYTVKCEVASILVTMPNGEVHEYEIDGKTVKFETTNVEDYTSYEVVAIK